MSIFRARLRNTSNALTLRMSGEQIRLQFPPQLSGVNSWIAQIDQAVNSRLLVWRQRMHGSEKCCSMNTSAANQIKSNHIY